MSGDEQAEGSNGLSDIQNVREMVAACLEILERETLADLHAIGRRIAKDKVLSGLPAGCLQVVRDVYKTAFSHLKSEAERARTVPVTDTPPF